ncbi:hypothetical protein D8911_11405 [Levilactobacillus brevis]|nr:hypothetical protein D8911_11405 [Levilactobacillus brevis]
MGLVIGDDVSKITLGGQVLYDRGIQDSSWIECPDEGTEGQDFKGLTLMKWDSTTNTARFKSSATVVMPSNYTPNDPISRLAITLPNGYEFADNADSSVFYKHYSSLGVSKNSYNISTNGNKLFVKLRNNDINANHFYLCEISSNSVVSFDAETQFNVVKII